MTKESERIYFAVKDDIWVKSSRLWVGEASGSVYHGKVLSVDKDGAYHVKFDDGEELGDVGFDGDELYNAHPNSQMKVGDDVWVKSLDRFSTYDAYRGVVRSKIETSNQGVYQFNILFEDGDEIDDIGAVGFDDLMYSHDPNTHFEPDDEIWVQSPRLFETMEIFHGVVLSAEILDETTNWLGYYVRFDDGDEAHDIGNGSDTLYMTNPEPGKSERSDEESSGKIEEHVDMHKRGGDAGRPDKGDSSIKINSRVNVRGKYAQEEVGRVVHVDHDKNEYHVKVFETGVVKVLSAEVLERYDLSWNPAEGPRFIEGETVVATLDEWDGEYKEGKVESQDPETGACTILFECDGSTRVCHAVDVDFSDEKDEDVMEKRKRVDDFLREIWDNYDKDQSGSLDAMETNRLLNDLTGKELSVSDCEMFISQFDGDGNMLIDREEMATFIAYGTAMDAVDRKEYASRGTLQTIMVAFFDGVDREISCGTQEKEEDASQVSPKDLTGGFLADTAQDGIKSGEHDEEIGASNNRENLNAETNTRLEEEMSDYGDDSSSNDVGDEKDEDVMEKRKRVDDFLREIWDNYDKDQSGSLDAMETNRLLNDLTGKELSVSDCEMFISQFDGDGNMLIDREEMATFIAYGTAMDAVDRKEYASRGTLQTIMVAFFDGVDREISCGTQEKEEDASQVSPKDLTGGFLADTAQDGIKSGEHDEEIGASNNNRENLKMSDYGDDSSSDDVDIEAKWAKKQAVQEAARLKSMEAEKQREKAEENQMALIRETNQQHLERVKLAEEERLAKLEQMKIQNIEAAEVQINEVARHGLRSLVVEQKDGDSFVREKHEGGRRGKGSEHGEEDYQEKEDGYRNRNVREEEDSDGEHIILHEIGDRVWVISTRVWPDKGPCCAFFGEILQYSDHSGGRFYEIHFDDGTIHLMGTEGDEIHQFEPLGHGWFYYCVEGEDSYFFNKESNQRQLDFPENVSDCMRQEDRHNMPLQTENKNRENDLGNGWVQVKADDGSPYYVNRLTDESGWNYPTGAAKPKPVISVQHENLNLMKVPSLPSVHHRDEEVDKVKKNRKVPSHQMYRKGEKDTSPSSEDNPVIPEGVKKPIANPSCTIGENSISSRDTNESTTASGHDFENEPLEKGLSMSPSRRARAESNNDTSNTASPRSSKRSNRKKAKQAQELENQMGINDREPTLKMKIGVATQISTAARQKFNAKKFTPNCIQHDELELIHETLWGNAEEIRRNEKRLQNSGFFAVCSGNREGSSLYSDLDSDHEGETGDREAGCLVQ